MSFEGVIVAAITPRRKNSLEADLGATLELIDFLAGAGVQGLALMGSTGEFVHLSFEDRIRLVNLAAKRSRVPILAGVSHSTLDGSVALAQQAIGGGASALLVMPPYFFRYDQEDVKYFFTQFAVEV